VCLQFITCNRLCILNLREKACFWKVVFSVGEIVVLVR